MITDDTIAQYSKVFLAGKSRSEWTDDDVEKCKDFLRPLYARAKEGKDILKDVTELADAAGKG